MKFEIKSTDFKIERRNEYLINKRIKKKNCDELIIILRM